MAPRGFDWIKAADAIGPSAHSFAGSAKVREIMAAAGITGLPLSPYEVAEIKALRERAANNLAAAEAIERRATVEDDGP